MVVSSFFILSVATIFLLLFGSDRFSFDIKLSLSDYQLFFDFQGFVGLFCRIVGGGFTFCFSSAVRLSLLSAVFFWFSIGIILLYM